MRKRRSCFGMDKHGRHFATVTAVPRLRAQFSFWADPPNDQRASNECRNGQQRPRLRHRCFAGGQAPLYCRNGFPASDTRTAGGRRRHRRSPAPRFSQAASHRSSTKRGASGNPAPPQAHQVALTTLRRRSATCRSPEAGERRQASIALRHHRHDAIRHVAFSRTVLIRRLACGEAAWTLAGSICSRMSNE